MSFAAAQRAASPVAQLGRSQVGTVLVVLVLAGMQSHRPHLHHKVLGALPSSIAALADPGDKSLWHLEARAEQAEDIHAAGRSRCFQQENRSPDGRCSIPPGSHLKNLAKCRSCQKPWDPTLAPLGRDNHEGPEWTVRSLLLTPFAACYDMQWIWIARLLLLEGEDTATLRCDRVLVPCYGGLLPCYDDRRWRAPG
jgi:hypothetical protein